MSAKPIISKSKTLDIPIIIANGIDISDIMGTSPQQSSMSQSSSPGGITNLSATGSHAQKLARFDKTLSLDSYIVNKMRQSSSGSQQYLSPPVDYKKFDESFTLDFCNESLSESTSESANTSTNSLNQMTHMSLKSHYQINNLNNSCFNHDNRMESKKLP